MPPPKVLLLESVAAQAAAARNVLVGSGCRLVISRFEADGRKKIREWEPDVVILADTYPSGGLTAFCRQLREDTGRPFRLIIASSHTRERLSRQEPDIELLVDGFVLRPFNPEEIRGVIGGLGEKGRPAPPASGGGGQRGLRGKAVLVLDRDAEVHRRLREHLAPKGVELQIIEWERLTGTALSPRPSVILLGWPLPDGFSIEEFRKIQGGDGGVRPPVLLLSSAAREVVQAKTPVVLKVTNMLFIKPVAWKHFFRFLEQSLEKAPAPEAPRPPAAADEGGLRRRFQEELEVKFLEVEELKRRLRQAEKEAEKEAKSAAGDAQREENRRLREEVEEVKRQGALEHAKLKLRETDLEVKLSNLIRKKIDAERRAQDLIDDGTSRSDEMQRALEEAIGELQMRQEEQAALRADLEQATVEKEKVEEQLQVFLSDMEKEKKTLLAEKKSLEEEKERFRESAGEREQATAALETLSRRVDSAEAGLEARDAEVSGLEEKLRDGEEILADRDGKIAEEYHRASRAETELERLRQIVAAEEERERDRSARTAGLEEELQAKDADLAALKEELDARKAAVESLEKGLEEKERARRESEERLQVSEEAVAGLDVELSDWRRRLNEAGEELAGFKAELKEKAALVASLESGLEAKEAGLVELEERLKVSEESVAVLDGDLSEVRRRLQGAEESVVGGEAREEELRELRSLVEERETALIDERHRSSGMEAELKEKAALVASLESGLEGSAAELAAREEKLRTSEEAVAGLDGELAEVRGRFSEAQAELERLQAAGSGVKEEESAQAEKIVGLEAELKEKAALVAALESGLEGSAAELAAREEKLRISEEAVAGLDGELAEVRQRLTGTEAAAAAIEIELNDRRHRMAEGEAALADLTAREAVLAREMEERGDPGESHDKELREWKQRAEVAEAVTREYDRVKNLLEEVVTRAQTEVIERTRKEVELQEKLRTSLEEKKFVLARLERELVGATEREMRLTALLESAVRHGGGGGPVAASDNLPVAVPERVFRPGSLRAPAVAAALAVLLVGGVWMAIRSTPPPPPPSPAAGETGEASTIVPYGKDGSADPRVVWEEWTRRDVSGGVIMQATLRSEAELAAEIEAEKIANGWSRERADQELSRLLEPYRFDEYIYFYLYLKNMEPGYPGYVDGIADHLVLRDEKGMEAKGFLPPDMEKHRRVYSFTAGGLSKRDELIYEVAVPVAFSRKDLSPDPAYIELLAFNIGSSSRRVLTWELQ